MAVPLLRLADCCNVQSRHATMQLLVQDEHKDAAQRMLVPYPFIGDWQPGAVRLVVLCAIGRPTEPPAADGTLYKGVYPTASCEAALVKKLAGPRALFPNRHELAAALQDGRLFVAQAMSWGVLDTHSSSSTLANVLRNRMNSSSASSPGHTKMLSLFLQREAQPDPPSYVVGSGLAYWRKQAFYRAAEQRPGGVLVASEPGPKGVNWRVDADHFQPAHMAHALRMLSAARAGQALGLDAAAAAAQPAPEPGSGAVALLTAGQAGLAGWPRQLAPVPVTPHQASSPSKLAALLQLAEAAESKDAEATGHTAAAAAAAAARAGSPATPGSGRRRASGTPKARTPRTDAACAGGWGSPRPAFASLGAFAAPAPVAAAAAEPPPPPDVMLAGFMAGFCQQHGLDATHVLASWFLQTSEELLQLRSLQASCQAQAHAHAQAALLGSAPGSQPVPAQKQAGADPLVSPERPGGMPAALMSPGQLRSLRIHSPTAQLAARSPLVLDLSLPEAAAVPRPGSGQKHRLEGEAARAAGEHKQARPDHGCRSPSKLQRQAGAARADAEGLRIAGELSRLQRNLAALPGAQSGTGSGAQQAQAGSRDQLAAAALGLLQRGAALLGSCRQPDDAAKEQGAAPPGPHGLGLSHDLAAFVRPGSIKGPQPGFRLDHVASSTGDEEGMHVHMA